MYVTYLNIRIYRLERPWCLAPTKDADKLAIGYDEGTVVLKLGYERPVASLDTNTGKYIYVCTYVYTYVCAYIYINVYTYLYKYVYICINIITYIYICIYVHIDMFIYLYIDKIICIYI
jgi:hypothetical protein